MLQELCDHNDPALCAWAIEYLGIDIPAEWPDLDDEARERLIEWGLVGEVDPTVTVASTERWDEGCSDNGGYWPDYLLSITAEGLAQPMSAAGWHFVGEWDGHCDGCPEDWACRDDDGACNGLPTVDEWLLCDGDNVSSDGDGLIPCWRLQDGSIVTIDRDSLRDAIEDAAGTVDHGDEPTWDDVEHSDCDDTEETRYIIHDGVIAEVDILTGGLAPTTTYDPDTDRDVTAYHAQAWAHSLDEDTVYESLDDCLDAVRQRADDGKARKSEAKALMALCELATDQHGVPDWLTTGTDDDGWYVASEDDEDERYHFSSEDATSLLKNGWSGVLDTLREALGTRATLAALIEERTKLDAIVTELDPFVGVEDSLASGNCRAVTDIVTREMREIVGGEVGAVRASLLLAHRDDQYSRRAVRQAARRLMTSR